MLGSMATRDFAAIHMMWGAVNELTTLTGYHALIRRCDHPVLHQLLRKVIRDERRHFAFYRAQAKARMQRAAPPADRPLGPRPASGRRWERGSRREEEVDALALYLFGDGPEGREQIREIDQTISDVPGLEGMTIVEDYLDGALRRAAERPGWAGVADTHVAPATPTATPRRPPTGRRWAPRGRTSDRR